MGDSKTEMMRRSCVVRLKNPHQSVICIGCRRLSTSVPLKCGGTGSVRNRNMFSSVSGRLRTLLRRGCNKTCANVSGSAKVVAPARVTGIHGRARLTPRGFSNVALRGIACWIADALS